MHKGSNLGPLPCGGRPFQHARQMGTVWVMGRRFDPRSSPSASSAKATFSPGELVSNLAPSSAANSNSSSGLPNRHSCSIILRNARFSPDLCTSPIRYGSRNTIVFKLLVSAAGKGVGHFTQLGREHLISKLMRRAIRCLLCRGSEYCPLSASNIDPCAALKLRVCRNT